MKKSIIYSLQTLCLAMAIFFQSCGSSEPVVPQGTPTITAELDPASVYKNNNFEVGESINVRVTMNVPGGVQIFQITKKVGTAAEGSDISQSFSTQGLPAAGATTFTKVFTIPVTEAVGSNVIYYFKVKSSQSNLVTVAATYLLAGAPASQRTTFTYATVASGLGGGGGTAPLLRANLAVALGSQTVALGSFFSTLAATAGSTTAGVYTSTDVAGLSAGSQQAIDITFGVGNAMGVAQTGVAATHNILISPDERVNKNFANPILDANRKTTTFKTTTITTLTGITSTGLNNAIDHSTGSAKFVASNTGTPIYSFVNSRGAKGYIRIASVTGTGDARTANIEVLVQVVL